MSSLAGRTSAPVSRSRLTTVRWPPLAAPYSGVAPDTARELMLDLAIINSSTMASCPFVAALCRAVDPLAVFRLTCACVQWR